MPDDELVASVMRLHQAVASAEVIDVSRYIGVRTRTRAWGLPGRPLPDTYVIEGGELHRQELEQAAAELVPGEGVPKQPEQKESAYSPGRDSMADHHRADPVVDALEAVALGRLEPGCVIHSDCGLEYSSGHLHSRISELGHRQGIV